MDWTQVDIFTTTAGVEPLGVVLLELGLGGFAVKDAADFESFLAGNEGRWDYIEDELMQLRDVETTLTVYIADNEQGAENMQALRTELARLRELDTDGEWGRLETSLCNVREEDWAFGWKKYYTPTKIGTRLVVCPSWEEYAAQPDEVVVRLDPGMAFGTGTHDSTRLCMQLMERHLPTDARVLDLGCGSGILAVSALLLGAREAVGVDIDEVAVRVAGENAALNGVNDRCTFVCGSLADKVQGVFDVIFANIVADVIIGFTPQVTEYLAPGGVFIVSGIIDTREQDVLDAAAAAGLCVVERKEAGGWVAATLAKK